MKEVRL